MRTCERKNCEENVKDLDYDYMIALVEVLSKRAQSVYQRLEGRVET